MIRPDDFEIRFGGVAMVNMVLGVPRVRPVLFERQLGERLLRVGLVQWNVNPRQHGHSPWHTNTGRRRCHPAGKASFLALAVRCKSFSGKTRRY
jgi:hypothetical protein